MIITQREIHHRANFNFPVNGNWSRHDLMHAEDAALWRIQDRRGEERSVHSAVCDGECAALQVFDFQFSVARPAGEIGDVTLQLGKTFLVRIAHDRDNESALSADRDADVVKIVLDEIVSFDAAVDYWHRFERFHTCLDKERHQTQFDVVLFRELLLRFCTQFLHGAHVAFVKSREDGGGLLRHHQLRCDLAA